MTPKLPLLSSIALLAIVAGSTVPARAAEISPGVTLDTELRLQGVGLHNGDLGTSGDDTLANAALAARFLLTAHFNPDNFFFWEGRAVASAGRAGFESGDTGSISSGDSFLEWRQSYLEFDHIVDTSFGAKFGRQKVREPYGLWWNQNFDALQAFYDTTIFRGAITAGQDLFSYRTSNDDFTENEQDIANVMVEGSWQYQYENFFEARLMAQNDHSDLNVGDIQPDDDPDSATGHYLWAGLRATGDTHFLSTGPRKTGYRFDLLGVTGNEDVTTIAPFGPGTNIVTALSDQDVRGWGFDGAVDVPLRGKLPILHFGYAFGSGDDNPADGTDHGFRQNGLHGNYSRIGALTENTDNYGTVLRPELSNIHIVSVGATLPVLDASDAGLIYRYYRLDEPTTALAASGLENTLNGVDRSLGQGVDLLFNMDIPKETGFTVSHVEDMKLRSSLGVFRASDAFGAGDGEYAVRGLVELKVKL